MNIAHEQEPCGEAIISSGLDVAILGPETCRELPHMAEFMDESLSTSTPLRPRLIVVLHDLVFTMHNPTK